MVNHDDHRDAWIELGHAVDKLTTAIRDAARHDLAIVARAANNFARALRNR